MTGMVPHQVVQMRRCQTSHHLAMWPGGFDDLTRNIGEFLGISPKKRGIYIIIDYLLDD